MEKWKKGGKSRAVAFLAEHYLRLELVHPPCASQRQSSTEDGRGPFQISLAGIR
jgi:hypothetical protein